MKISGLHQVSYRLHLRAVEKSLVTAASGPEQTSLRAPQALHGVGGEERTSEGGAGTAAAPSSPSLGGWLQEKE